MNTGTRVRVLAAVTAGMVLVLCDTVSAVSAANVSGSVGAGGGLSGNASYSIDSSIGVIGGDSTAGSVRNMAGGPAIQPATATNLTVKASPVSVNEGDTGQLSGSAWLDDGTFVLLGGSDIYWQSPTPPISSINDAGVLTAARVYADTTASVTGIYLNVTASTPVTVLNINSDDYGNYAGDGVPDWWQVQYFGINNPNGVGSADATGTGQNNLFKYVAGLDPTNPASVFVLKIASVPGQPNQKSLAFKPWATGRTYTPEYRTNLVTGAYANLTGYSGPTTNSTEVSVTDLSATQASKFYRIKITYP